MTANTNDPVARLAAPAAEERALLESLDAIWQDLLARDYPRTVAECIDESIRYRRGIVGTVRAFARTKPWKGTIQQRARKFARLNRRLAAVCGIIVPRLRLDVTDARPRRRASGWYNAATHTIGLTGRLSVVTYLHEFAHALGKGETGACRWSINLFKRCFPRSFARCVPTGHELRQPQDDVSHKKNRKENRPTRPVRADSGEISTFFRELRSRGLTD